MSNERLATNCLSHGMAIVGLKEFNLAHRNILYRFEFSEVGLI
jgi:hypothetical protein